MDIIQNNPFRIVGTPVNSKLKDRLANLSKIKAYTRIGKEVFFPLDDIELFGKVSRTVDSLEKAVTLLNSRDDFLKNALFWLYTLTPEQEEAFQCIQKKDFKAAQELYSKNKDFGSLIGLSVLAFSKGSFPSAMSNIHQIFFDEKMAGEFNAFVSNATGQERTLSSEELLGFFIEALLENVLPARLIKIYVNSGKQDKIFRKSLDILNEKNSQKTITKFKSSITLREEECKANPIKAFKEAPEFVQSCRDVLRGLAKAVGESAVAYKDACDSLAQYIIAVVREYTDLTEDEEPTESDARKVVDLLKKARSYACSMSLKHELDSMLNAEFDDDDFY